jgi:hypothetical protein
LLFFSVSPKDKGKFFPKLYFSKLSFSNKISSTSSSQKLIFIVLENLSTKLKTSPEIEKVFEFQYSLNSKPSSFNFFARF